jgi:hypothetical protein
MNNSRGHTTVGLKHSTKSKLNKRRAPGQSYDGFLGQLMDLWDKAHASEEQPARPSPSSQTPAIQHKGGAAEN